VVRLAPADQRGRALGVMQSAFLVGIALGPSIGGLLADPLGLRWPFVIYGGFCTAAGAVALALLPAPRDADDFPRRGLGAGDLFRAARRLVSNPAFVGALVLMAASRWAAQGLRFSLIPLLGEQRAGASLALVGGALTLASATQLASLWPAGRITDGPGRRALAVPAYGFFAVATGALGFAASPVAFAVALGFYGVGTGLASVPPPAIVGDVTADDDTGTGIGVLNTAGDLGTVGGIAISGGLAEVAGFPLGFAAPAVLLLIAAGAAARMPETLARGG